ncbi:DUF6457 domain-containing protein [Streptomyces sp. NBC_00564]|uniref:DUF6457 domain-containing protein n=1 Tax=Streptomyces sp. NBC_00564 TaxID=2903663 RepID=UPI00352E1AA5|nr:molybdenum cofactor guanylyltransferase [Streptomyces sp. NBC_00564]
MNAYEAPGDPGAGLPYDAVVLAGGAARRLGGADKPGVRVGGRALLDRVLTACAGAATTVVVAERRATARPVLWAREDPPGGGPLAALDAGLRHTTAEYVVVLSADLPFLDDGTVRRLLETLRANTGAGNPADTEGELSGPDGALLVDSGGKDQPLVAAYRVRALRRELDSLAAASNSGSAAGGGLTGLPLRRLTAALDLIRISDPVASFDCDTWDDIAVARARIREHGHVLDEWITAVKDELGIDLDVDIGILLDLARDAAHGVARPAAPLTTFLVGYAAGRAQGGPEAVAEASRKAAALALRWADEDAADAKPDAAKPDAGPAGGSAPGAGSDARPDAG